MSFILASASPRRLELLRQIGLEPVEILAPEIDETPHKNELPRDYALRMACEKASAVALMRPSARILAADTVVACGRRILEKTEDEKVARKHLELLSGRRHRVYTAVCVYFPDGTQRIRISMTQVQFKRLHPKEIDAYLQSGEWRGKAGSYAIQGCAAAFVLHLNGSYSSVVGLPLAETKALLDFEK
jgi:septum formation protein